MVTIGSYLSADVIPANSLLALLSTPMYFATVALNAFPPEIFFLYVTPTPVKLFLIFATYPHLIFFSVNIHPDHLT